MEVQRPVLRPSGEINKHSMEWLLPECKRPVGRWFERWFERPREFWGILTADFSEGRRWDENGSQPHRATHQTLSAARRKLQTDHPSPSVDHPSPSVDHPSPSVDHPSPSVDHPSPSVDHPSGSVDHPGGSVEHPRRWADHQISLEFHRDASVEFRIGCMERH
jgi:hypothetical protein